MSDANNPTGMPLPDALAGNFQDAVRWFTQLWGGSMDPTGAVRAGAGALPSMMMPTLDVKELEKRIGDLRSVEHWLNLNLTLLRTTIQALEMQRSTLAAWQAFGASSASPSGAGGSGPAAKADSAGTGGAPEAPAAFQPALWWAALQQQFAQMAASASAQGDAAAAQAPAQAEDSVAGSTTETAPASAKPTGKTKSPGPSRA